MLEETPANKYMQTISTPPPHTHTTFVFIALIGKVTDADSLSREQINMYPQNNSEALKRTRHRRNSADLLA